MAEPDDDSETPEVASTPAPATSAPPTTSVVPATTSAPAPDFNSLVVTPEQMAATRQRLLGIQQAKTATDTANAAETEKRLGTDRARMEAAYNATATMPDELNQDWNAEKKSAEHYTDPVTAFGSIGSVFTMLASAFTGVPMEGALNAGAAAINAVHAGDEKAYTREFEAWQKNTALALKRHEIQHQTYNDATNLMNSNINAGRTKMELAATRFGDQKVQALLENGMDKELADLFVARNKAALEMKSEWDKIELQNEKVKMLRADPRYQSDDLNQKYAAIADMNRAWAPGGASQARYDFTRDYIDNQKKTNPNYTPADLLKWGQEAATAQGDITEGGGDGKESTQAIKSKAIREIVAKSQAEVDAGTRTAPKSLVEATAEYNRTTSVPSGNRQDDQARQINMYENGIAAIDRTLGMINKHVGAVGAAGYATRLGERLGNVAGSSETDRSQIAHDIQYLQTVAPRLLNDSSGRPLSAEAGRINSIIAGLSLGDTTANTKRSLGEVRDLWLKMQQDNMARRSGAPNLPDAGATNPAYRQPATGGKAPAPTAPSWKNAPLVSPAAGPRAEADDMADTGAA